MSKRITTFILFSSFFIPAVAFCQVRNVWALGDGEKVFCDDLNHPSKKGNLTWDGKTIHLTGLFNEVLAFQVIVETGNDSVKGIEVSITNPTNKASAKTIGGNTLKHGSGGTIEVFSEHYLHVTDSTRPNWFYGSPAAAPKKNDGLDTGCFNSNQRNPGQRRLPG